MLDLGGGVTGVARFADGRLQDIHSRAARRPARHPGPGVRPVDRLAAGGAAQDACTAACCRAPATRTSGSRCRGIGDPGQPAAPDRVAGAADRDHPAAGRGDSCSWCAPASAGSPLAGRRLVLTGGGSQIEGVVELAEEVFDMPARVGRARPFDGRPEVAGLTAATTAAGLLTWSVRDDGGLTFWSPRSNRMQPPDRSPSSASGCERTFEHRADQRPAQEEGVRRLGTATEEDV